MAQISLSLFSMANYLTFFRFLLAIPFVACFYWASSLAMPIALLLFIIASLTDFLDGWVARKLNQITKLGAALDPLADKILTVAALLCLVDNNSLTGINLIGVIIIIMREISVSGLREATSQYGHKLSVTGLAKWKTTAQMIAITGLLTALAFPLTSSWLYSLSLGLFWLSVVLTFWTGTQYTVKAISLLRQKT